MMNKVRGGWQLSLGDWVGPTRKTKTETEIISYDTLSDLLQPRNFEPAIFQVPNEPGAICVVTCGLDNTWSYTFYRPVDGVFSKGGTCSGGWNRCSEAIVHCRRHLAQMAYTGTEESREAALNWLWPDDDEGRAELIPWIEWQNRFQAAKACGYNDEDARNVADGKGI